MRENIIGLKKKLKWAMNNLAAVLVTRILGMKGNVKTKRFLVVDAAMTDFLRPSLPGTYHEISLVVQSHDEVNLF